MPSKLKLLMILSFVPLALGGILWLDHTSSSRHPSHDPGILLKQIRSHSTIHIEKHLAPIKISLQAMEEIPEGPDQLVTLKAEIVSTYEGFGPLNYAWSLPPGVELVKGLLNDTIINPIAGKPYELEVVVKNFDRQYRRKIHIKAQIMDPDGVQLHGRALITSRPEDSMEHLAPTMMVQAHEAKMKERLPASTSE